MTDIAEFVTFKVYKNNNQTLLCEGKLSPEFAYLTSKKFNLSFRGYPRFHLNGKTVILHRFVINAPEGSIVDHINGDKLDSRIQNLRIVDHSLNSHNRSAKVREHAKFVGTSLDKNKLWTAWFNGKRIGSNCPSEVEAAAIYNFAVIQKYGDQGNLNNIDLVYKAIPEEYTPKKNRVKGQDCVYKNKSGTFTARLRYDMIHYNLGTFATEEEAQDKVAEARRLAEKKNRKIIKNSNGVAYLIATNGDHILVDDDIAERFCRKAISKIEDYYYASKQRLHRLIVNAEQNQIVDHINGDKQNLLRSNLRLATPSQNSQNRKKRENCTSKYIGVSYAKSKKIWIASIQFSYVSFQKQFKTELEAAQWYDQKALEFYGPNAKVNFPIMKPHESKEDKYNMVQEDQFENFVNPSPLGESDLKMANVIFKKPNPNGTVMLKNNQLSIDQKRKIVRDDIRQKGSTRKLASGWQTRMKFEQKRYDFNGFVTEEEAKQFANKKWKEIMLDLIDQKEKNAIVPETTINIKI